MHVASKGVTNATYMDLQRQQSLGFEFADVSSPDDFAVTLSSTAQVYWPPQDVLKGPEVMPSFDRDLNPNPNPNPNPNLHPDPHQVMSFFDRDLVLKLLDMMQPANMLVLLSSTSLTKVRLRVTLGKG